MLAFGTIAAFFTSRFLLPFPSPRPGLGTACKPQSKVPFFQRIYTDHQRGHEMSISRRRSCRSDPADLLLGKQFEGHRERDHKQDFNIEEQENDRNRVT